MKFLSVCSGIEAASVAWHPLGWRTHAVSEIEAFPCAVLAHHHPGVPNWGDLTKFKDWPDATIDLLVGGTPCQSFSVAGLRKGMDDPRGNLALTYLAVADRYRPEWLVWENVPGVLSSSGGRDFGSFLGGLAELGYGFAYRILDAQYVRVDGFGRAVPQRRRRVFVVGHSGSWRRAAAVLFERESLSGHSAPRRQAGQNVAPTVSSRPSGGGGLGTDFDCDGGLISAEVAATLPAGGNATGGDRQPGTSAETAATMLIARPLPFTLAIRGRGDGHNLEYRQDGTSNAILTPNGGRAGIGVGAIAFDTTQITSSANRSNPKAGDACHPLAAGAHAPAIAFDARQSDVIQYGQIAGPLDTDAFSQAVHTGWAVRRLTPRECERLQGFPDDYTLIPHRGKPAADGPRYKALGNSMAVNAMRWLGRRIDLVSTISAEVAA